ncbi:PE-PGRS protein, putative [Trichomonas vaginalis G3]|uniref:receptor protein-tyrosine kinase n=1 Tax=Trichomonas vaginalis (strain ATCC PRA-98 / G3) TaxID=412133 RepID=A2G4Q8_TRIV3|nr:glycine-rich protein family [Trichomonas vaginalis G3]EAX87852.1 PE-PGRS protein, putative [Trichomonas vaginalis G3]KAI5504920.1 glycine-rich protein family [Trichomonas vaginalis G3]|eukprot:XP_001300782.1 PE-PGRS protein [Trichomonas vaginalis G3]
MIEGGYGGGGYASNYFGNDEFYGSGSGGGQTAVKFEVNDLWHRVIVSGAGGGCDDNFGTFNSDNDGSGGAGGIIGQGWFLSGVYNFSYLANSTSGFSFGYGESAQKLKSLNPKGVQTCSGDSDRAGAGSGWFGGFESHNGQSGSGGGSSWVLSKDAIIPQGKIEAFDSFYQSIGKYEYAFTNSDYLFDHIFHTSGVWEGNGKLIITILNHCIFNTKFLCYRLHIFNLFLFSISIYES